MSDLKLNYLKNFSKEAGLALKEVNKKFYQETAKLGNDSERNFFLKLHKQVMTLEKTPEQAEKELNAFLNARKNKHTES